MSLSNTRVQAKIALVTAGPKESDVMISYDKTDKDIVLKLQASLQSSGLTVWMDSQDIMTGADVLTKIGQAVVECKVFIFALSTASVQSKLCQDQLALAYVSKKSIFPVALESRDELLTGMDNGMRLQLAGFPWYNLTVDNFKSEVKELCSSVNEDIGKQNEEDQQSGKLIYSNERREQSQKTQETKFRKKMLKTYTEESNYKAAKMHLEDGNAYWLNTFGAVTKTPWAKFKEKLLKNFKDDFQQTFGEEDTEWLIKILHRELEVGSDEIVYKDNYIEFCTCDEMVQPLWLRVQEQARESYAMREVFRMDSLVRAQAIENLGKFKSATVVDALRDLLTDKDVNIQAVAIISLARTGSDDKETIEDIMKCLSIKDRVVREAACLALGHLKVENAIDRLVDLWRNDIISNVREAALVALKNIGGDKAENAIRVTQVLEKEIRRLKQS